MKTSSDILNQFPKHLFWDMDISQLDVKSDMDIIIPRSLFATTEASFEADIRRLEKIYDQNLIVTTLQSTKERISNNLCRLVAQHYQIPVFYRYKK